MPNGLPYLHFMQKVFFDDWVGLMSPSEMLEPTSPGGCIFAPVYRNGRFHPVYCFDFAVYLGSGRREEVTTGYAYRAVHEHSQLLIAIFRDRHELPSRVQPFYSPPELFLQIAGDNPAIVFKKEHGPTMPSSFKYGGKLRHPDFRHKFIELETIKRRALDDLFNTTKVVFIGCDPSTKYEGEEV